MQLYKGRQLIATSYAGMYIHDMEEHHISNGKSSSMVVYVYCTIQSDETAFQNKKCIICRVHTVTKHKHGILTSVLLGVQASLLSVALHAFGGGGGGDFALEVLSFKASTLTLLLSACLRPSILLRLFTKGDRDRFSMAFCSSGTLRWEDLDEDVAPCVALWDVLELSLAFVKWYFKRLNDPRTEDVLFRENPAEGISDNCEMRVSVSNMSSSFLRSR